ncbi:calcium/proton exchanger [Thozetella sp. PMI_491]|nr:calcium/proton exchanger [Thozetella sp. PMI_491]
MHRVRTWARAKALGSNPRPSEPRKPNGPTRTSTSSNATSAVTTPAEPKPDQTTEAAPPAAPETPAKRRNIFVEFIFSLKHILLASYVNLLLVFVPVGFAVHFANLSPGIIFAMNAIAIIPLAGLLSQSTEAVASRMGDTIGALMNVTFGNAVELIIFIIALVKDEIRIVQASLLGSILANLLLILGMCFLLGGFRFREQIYNSTVTQMSACLLSLSVTSLLLPTAFHASFNDSDLADTRVLQVSRGTSVVLLLVYILYLLFQLNSHSYMYESTPQHIIERESIPWETDSSSSSSSSSSSDSDGSNAAKRFRRKIRGKMSRKGSHSASNPSSPAIEAKAEDVQPGESLGEGATASASIDNAEITVPVVVDDGMEEADELAGEDSPKKHKKKHKKHHRKHRREANGDDLAQTQSAPGRQVAFVLADLEAQHVIPARTTLFQSLRQNVFTNPPQNPVPASSTAPRPQIRRVNSMPERQGQVYRSAPGSLPPIVPIVVNSTPRPKPTAEEEEEPEISRSTAILLLLVSTGLVAVCAEFMVDSISGVVADGSGVSEAFVGLILLPIVGNAAEHVTSVAVAVKNKMDLAIGVALGSSIQIAIFVTPLVVILGWIMGKNMSLFFTLFETVCLFVSAFIVNFLVLDGRSNYLEGALLCSAYIIIAVAAFFYPNEKEANELGGGEGTSQNETTQAVATEVSRLLVRGVVNMLGY